MQVQLASEDAKLKFHVSEWEKKNIYTHSLIFLVVSATLLAMLA